MAAALAALASCAHYDRFRNGDLVVMGRVQTTSSEALDEFGLNGMVRARLSITRVVKGVPPGPILTVKYIAHTDLPSEEDIRFHLRPASDGTYVVCKDHAEARGYICR